MIDFTNYEKLKTKLEPIFVPVKEEESYCRKHKISRVKLDNGVNILGIERPISDSVHTSIQFKFASGAYFDPPDKKGLHHLTEHLFNRRLRLVNQDKKGIEVNASTGSLEVHENIGGATNVAYPSFGLWPFIGQTVEMLKSPVDQYDNPQEVLDGERAAVEKEIMERDANQSRLCFNHVIELVYGKTNPYATLGQILGTKKSICGITVDDCRRLADKVLGSENLTVSFTTEATGNTVKSLTDELTKRLGDFRSAGKGGLSDIMIRESVNSSFMRRHNYSHDTGLRDGKAMVFLIWSTEAHPAENNYWVRNSIIEESITKSFHLLSRKYGWSYSSYFDVITPFWYRTIFLAGLIVPKNTKENLFNFGQEVSEKVNKELFPRLNKKVASGLLGEQRIQLMAQPVRQATRLDFLVEGENDFGGRIIDPEMIREKKLMAETKDVLFWRDYLAETKPVVVVVGDVES